MNKVDSDKKNQQCCPHCGCCVGVGRNGRRYKCGCNGLEYVLCSKCQTSTEETKAMQRGDDKIPGYKPPLCPECYIEYLDHKLDNLE